MLLINLHHDPDTSGFTSAQAAAIIEAARFMAHSNRYGPEEASTIEDLAEITRVWAPIAAQPGAPAARH